MAARMSKEEEERILQRIAREHNTSVEEVRKEIQAVIDLAYDNPDPARRAYWRDMAPDGRKPSIGEMLIWMATQAVKEDFMP